jgi:hypothetical protein
MISPTSTVQTPARFGDTHLPKNNKKLRQFCGINKDVFLHDLTKTIFANEGCHLCAPYQLSVSYDAYDW